jgi:ribulose bisphosphate carboxylase small subunit
MRLETFSYLPGLSAEQLAQQIRSLLRRRLVVGIEFSSAPDPRDH